MLLWSVCCWRSSFFFWTAFACRYRYQNDSTLIETIAKFLKIGGAIRCGAQKTSRPVPPKSDLTAVASHFSSR